MSNTDPVASSTDTYWQQVTDQGTPSQSIRIITGEDAITLYQDAGTANLQYCVGTPVFLAAEQDVTIYANRVYFLAGSSSFPGQNISIHAREIGTVGPAGVPARLAVDGAAGGAAAPKVPNTDPAGPSGASAGGPDPHPTAGGQGAQGAQGGQGTVGNVAGSISLYCYAILPNTLLQLSAVGGMGGIGQDGQDGQDGGIGGQGGDVYGNTSAPCAAGGVGGTGGTGGIGGTGGVGGTVDLYCVSQVPADAVISINTAGGVGGPGGPGGFGGPGGPGGVSHSAMPGFPGNQGNSGAPGAIGATGTSGQPGSQNFEENSPSYTATAFAGSLNAYQCQMVIERARLLYLEADGTTADPLFAQAYDAFSFYASLYDQSAATLSDPLKSILAQATSYTVQLNSKLDVYGRPYNYVPLVSYNTYDALLSEQLAMFATIETAFDGYFANLQQQKQAAQHVQDCITSTTASIASNKASIVALLDDASALVPSIEAAQVAVVRAQAVLQAAIVELKDMIEGDIGCPLVNILESVGMSILTSGKVSPSSVITAALSGLASYNPNSVPFGLGSLNRAFLVSLVQFVESNVQSIKEGYGNIGGLITEDDPNGARLVQAEIQFDELYTLFFNKWGAAQAVEQAFTAYVQAVQYRNQLISNYNNDYIQACTLWQSDQSLQQLLQKAQDCLQGNNGPFLPEVVTFMSHAYHQARTELIRSLYLTSRAQQFWAVAPYDGLRALIGLDDPSQINSSTLATAQYQLLANFENAITNQGQVSESFSPLQIVIDDSNTLMAFRDDPQLLIPISPVMADTPASPSQPFAGLANVRLTTVRVYVEGASTANGALRVSIMHGGYETIVSPDNVAMSFIHKPLSVTFQYALAAPNGIAIDGTIGDTTADDNFALIGPFTTWSVKVDPLLNAGLDLSQVSRITIEFGGTFSSFPQG